MTSYRGRRMAWQFFDNYVPFDRQGSLPTPLPAMLGLSLKDLDDRELECAEHAAQAFIAACRVECHRRQGVKIVAGWGKSGFPGAVKREWSRGSYWDGTLGYPEADHAYRKRWPADEARPARTSYVAEPYRLDTEALRSLVKLADQGWEVVIDPRHAMHYPGYTMVVSFRRAEPRQTTTEASP